MADRTMTRPEPVAPAAADGPLVCMTGGGTAGHVTPHFALRPLLESRGCRLMYIGGRGIESELVGAAGIEFHAIATGKLRRYLSFENFLDLFRIAWGTLQALGILRRRRPAVVFSKGGFVAVPVCLAARLLGIPVLSHESDLTPGLANRLIKPFATRILYTFPETARLLPGDRALHTGSPVRAELFDGDRRRGLMACGFDPGETLPTLLVMGGSQGAQRINDALLAALPELVRDMRVIHLTGAGKGIPFTHSRYKSFEFVREGLADLLAAADLVVGRAGANSIFELLALRRPMLLVPLEQGSRGDQIVNAESFVRQGWAHLLRDRDLTRDSLLAALTGLKAAADAMRRAQAAYEGRAAAARITEAVLDAARRRT